MVLNMFYSSFLDIETFYNVKKKKNLIKTEIKLKTTSSSPWNCPYSLGPFSQRSLVMINCKDCSESLSNIQKLQRPLEQTLLPGKNRDQATCLQEAQTNQATKKDTLQLVELSADYAVCSRFSAFWSVTFAQVGFDDSIVLSYFCFCNSAPILL